MNLTKYNLLKTRVDAIQSEADRDEGARDRAKQQGGQSTQQL